MHVCLLFWTVVAREATWQRDTPQPHLVSLMCNSPTPHPHRRCELNQGSDAAREAERQTPCFQTTLSSQGGYSRGPRSRGPGDGLGTWMERDPPWRLRLLTDLLLVCFLSNAFDDAVGGVDPTLVTPLASFCQNTFHCEWLLSSDLLMTLPSLPPKRSGFNK